MKIQYHCSIVEADDQTQEIVCENGGSPAGDYCSCPTGFTGTRCETGTLIFTKEIIHVIPK